MKSRICTAFLLTAMMIPMSGYPVWTTPGNTYMAYVESEFDSSVLIGYGCLAGSIAREHDVINVRDLSSLALNLTAYYLCPGTANDIKYGVLLYYGESYPQITDIGSSYTLTWSVVSYSAAEDQWKPEAPIVVTVDK